MCVIEQSALICGKHVGWSNNNERGYNLNADSMKPEAAENPLHPAQLSLLSPRLGGLLVAPSLHQNQVSPQKSPVLVTCRCRGSLPSQARELAREAAD
jgi:hypothetical protein